MIKQELLDDYVDQVYESIKKIEEPEDEIEESDEQWIVQLEPQLAESALGEGQNNEILLDGKLAELSDLYYKKDRELKIGKVIVLCTKPGTIADAAKIISSELKMGDKTTTQFIDQQQTQHAPEKEIISQLMQGIENLLDQLLKSTEVSVQFETKNDDK
jgi:hypothetical protein